MKQETKDNIKIIMVVLGVVFLSALFVGVMFWLLHQQEAQIPKNINYTCVKEYLPQYKNLSIAKLNALYSNSSSSAYSTPEIVAVYDTCS